MPISRRRQALEPGRVGGGTDAGGPGLVNNEPQAGLNAASLRERSESALACLGEIACGPVNAALCNRAARPCP